MSLIQNSLLAILPPNRKTTPSGWGSFNAPCCHHRGDRRDDRKRGGIMLAQDGFVYHCFNCGFKAGWSKGKLLSKNTKTLFAWLGMPESEVQKLSLEALKEQQGQPTVQKVISFDLKEVELPKDCKKFADVTEPDEDFIKVVEYVLSRKMDLGWYDWMWSPEPGYRDRVIIPYYQDDKIVGFTGRKIRDGKPKYLAHSQPGYVFNLTSQTNSRKFVIVVEGQFDAIAVGGCAIGHNEPNETQIMRLNSLGREVIVVPDRDKAGAKMLKAAIDCGWSVSLPPWGDDVKDVADAVKKYGRMYVLAAILQYRVHGEIKINLLKKKLEAIHE